MGPLWVDYPDQDKLQFSEQFQFFIIVKLHYLHGKTSSKTWPSNMHCPFEDICFALGIAWIPLIPPLAEQANWSFFQRLTFVVQNT